MESMEWPPLYKRDKRGRVRVWRVRADGTTGDIIVSHGLVDGVLQDDVRTGLVFPKNHEWANGRWVHKKDREKYEESVDGTQPQYYIRPMLAKTFSVSRPQDVHFPVYVQPKLDGVRCLVRWDPTTQSVNLLSRTGICFSSPHLDHLREPLRAVCEPHPEWVLDGELYHNDIPFEELSGMCRRRQGSSSSSKNSSLLIRYVLFDMIDPTHPDRPFQERWSIVDNNIVWPDKVTTRSVDSMEQIVEAHTEYTAPHHGYEGIMIRTPDGVYAHGFRSDDLKKYKIFDEDEFLITGFVSGEGRETGTVVWECTTTGQKTFHVRPRGSHEYRRRLLIEAPSCIGRSLTVLHHGWTGDGIPRFPVGKCIREN